MESSKSSKISELELEPGSRFAFLLAARSFAALPPCQHVFDAGWVRVQNVPPPYLYLDFRLRLNAHQVVAVGNLFEDRFSRYVVEFRGLVREFGDGEEAMGSVVGGDESCQMYLTPGLSIASIGIGPPGRLEARQKRSWAAWRGVPCMPGIKPWGLAFYRHFPK